MKILAYGETLRESLLREMITLQAAVDQAGRSLTDIDASLNIGSNVSWQHSPAESMPPIEAG